ncbi:MAG: 2OG-Fe(II) oxygenase [Bacteroidota bacterium]|nr:2OG-Fe(II) oxygenase [Bacteroidota bacterium]
MTKFWYPERNELDAIPALLKNFIHYHKFPISKFTIEKDVKESPDFPMEISLATIMKLLQKWGIDHKAFKCPSENVTEVAPYTILFINDLTGKKGGDFIMFYGVRGNEIEYLDTRKGWVLEDLEEFKKKFANVALTADSIKEGEKDFELKEKEYEAKRLSNPNLNNVRVVDNFLTDSECEYIINLSTPLFKRSMFLYGDQKVLDEKRTSYSAELHIFPDDVVLNRIRKKASELINMPENHFEFFQCVSYDKQQEIDHHYDTFDPNSEGGKKIIAEGGQRKYTLLAYLNDDFEGGATYFPDLDYMVHPKKGSVVIFNNLDDNGNVLKCSWHGGLPVTTGRKYASNIWVHDKPCR